MTTSLKFCRANEIQMEQMRPSNALYYYRLESESQSDTDDGTESICSLQGRETEFVRDTSDTSSVTSQEFEIEIEYETEWEYITSDSEPQGENLLQASVTAAAIVCYDAKLDVFVTDVEDSDESSYNSSALLPDFQRCIRCLQSNDNPLYRFCEKCFQERKSRYPPRPRNKRKKRNKKSDSPEKLDVLQSHHSVLSQDSGIGSQDLNKLGLDQIVVPTSSIESSTNNTSRKRQISESSLSEGYDAPAKKEKLEENSEQIQSVQESVLSKQSTQSEDVTKTDFKVTSCDGNQTTQDSDSLCITCNVNQRNGLFLHGRAAHMCCCYTCAMRLWKMQRLCPICKRHIQNVVKLFNV